MEGVFKTTSQAGDSCIMHTLEREGERLATWIADTRDRDIRKKLLEMGWTAPDGEKDDEFIRRMSLAFAEKVSSLEGQIRNLELDKDQASAVIDNLADTNSKLNKRLGAQRKVIDSYRKQLARARFALGVRPPKRRFR